MKEYSKILTKIGIHLEVALFATRLIDMGMDISLENSKKFKEAITEALNSYSGKTSIFNKIKIEDFDIYVNRSPATPFFPIAASDDQYQAFNESLEKPPHAPIEEDDLELTLKEVIEKYKTAAFTLYKN